MLLSGRFSCSDVVPLLHDGVLCRGVEIAQASLQWRAFIDGAAAGDSEARGGDADTGGSDPYPSLRALGQQRLVSQRSGERMTPKAGGLDLMKGLRRLQIRTNTAELELEDFGVSHGDGGPQLLSARTGEIEKIIQCTLGNTKVDSAVQ